MVTDGQGTVSLGCGGRLSRGVWRHSDIETEDDFEVNSKSDRKPLQGHRVDINQITE